MPPACSGMTSPELVATVTAGYLPCRPRPALASNRRGGAGSFPGDPLPCPLGPELDALDPVDTRGSAPGWSRPWTSPSCWRSPRRSPSRSRSRRPGGIAFNGPPRPGEPPRSKSRDWSTWWTSPSWSRPHAWLISTSIGLCSGRAREGPWLALRATCRRCQSDTPHWRPRSGRGPFGRNAVFSVFAALLDWLTLPWQCSQCGRQRWPWKW